MIALYKREIRFTRSRGGKVVQMAILLLLGMFTLFPMVFVVSNAFKPLSELYIFPPRFLPISPTLDNFKNLLLIMSQSWVPFSRYLFNTVLITFLGTIGSLFFSSMAAFTLAKQRFPGRDIIFKMVVLSLMFTPAVTSIPNYIVMSKLGMIDTYFASILPAFQYSLGLYLMKQFMETIPDAVLESARIDGAGEVSVYWRIAMPMVKPAWLTMIILTIQNLWNLISPYTYSEELKTLPQAMQQILAGGIARAGVGSAVALLMMVVPLMSFIISQSSVIETMGTSGLKE